MKTIPMTNNGVKSMTNAERSLLLFMAGWLSGTDRRTEQGLKPFIDAVINEPDAASVATVDKHTHARAEPDCALCLGDHALCQLQGQRCPMQTARVVQAETVGIFVQLSDVDIIADALWIECGCPGTFKTGTPEGQTRFREIAHTAIIAVRKIGKL